MADVQDRFWEKVDFTLSGCWLWTAYKNQDGYGKFGVQSGTGYAHRLSYLWLVGEPPPGTELDHLCRNRACVRPDHLEPVSHRVNTRRGDAGKHLAIKTHCPFGHPYSGDNLLLSNGRRSCRTCRRRTWREFAAKKRAEVAS